MKKSQKEKLYQLLKDGQPHCTDEIQKVVYGSEHLGLCRIGARVCDLKKENHEIKGYKDKIRPSLYWYQLILKDEIKETKIKPQPELFKYQPRPIYD